jgi:hypothetical protein
MMTDTLQETSPAGAAAAALLARLQEALNAHDVEGLVALFDSGYRSEQPLHPERAFVGTAQVRRNWTTIFRSMPDFRAELVRSSVGAEVWAEWVWTGTERGGSRVLLRGVTIFGHAAGRIRWARLYVEPVDPALEE